ncbi:hypothetical protein D3C81_1660050 [compost metagenome]
MRPRRRFQAPQVQRAKRFVQQQGHHARGVAASAEPFADAVTERCLVEIGARDARQVDPADDLPVQLGQVLVGAVLFAFALRLLDGGGDGFLVIVGRRARRDPVFKIRAVFQFEGQQSGKVGAGGRVQLKAVEVWHGSVSESDAPL